MKCGLGAKIGDKGKTQRKLLRTKAKLQPKILLEPHEQWLIFDAFVIPNSNALVGPLRVEGVGARPSHIRQIDRSIDRSTFFTFCIKQQYACQGNVSCLSVYANFNFFQLLPLAVRTRAADWNRCRRRRYQSEASGRKKNKAQRLINLEIPVLVRSLKSSNVELGQYLDGTLFKCCLSAAANP